MKQKPPPPPKYPPVLHFRVLKNGQTIHMEVSSKHAEAPAPYNVVTLGMLRGGQVRLK